MVAVGAKVPAHFGRGLDLDGLEKSFSAELCGEHLHPRELSPVVGKKVPVDGSGDGVVVCCSWKKSTVSSEDSTKGKEVES